MFIVKMALSTEMCSCKKQMEMFMSFLEWRDGLLTKLRYKELMYLSLV